MTKKNKTSYKRIALALSLCALILWGVLGTGASLAWFHDTTPEINNIFHFADFELTLSHRLENGDWEPVDEKTKIFDEQALYEPGYVQTVYLRVKNTGDRSFEFHTAVNVNGCNVATNVFGGQLLLQEFLRFGITLSPTEAEMDATVPDRASAARIANMPLHNYASDTMTLEAGGEAYVALIVRMPEEVGNAANYREDTVPRVELGITVKAEQTKN